MHYWADLHSVHGFRCYDNIAQNAKCQRVLVLALCLDVVVVVVVVVVRIPLSSNVRITLSSANLSSPSLVPFCFYCVIA